MCARPRGRSVRCRTPLAGNPFKLRIDGSTKRGFLGLRLYASAPHRHTMSGRPDFASLYASLRRGHARPRFRRRRALVRYAISRFRCDMPVATRMAL
jgi:hypothetical protein